MHMFCKKCGKELEDNVHFCNYCGTDVESNVVEFKGAFGDKEPENSESSEPQYNYEYVSPEQVSQKAVEEPVEKDVTINIAGHKIKGRLIMKIAAVVAAACFFFPMFMVSCAGVNVGNVSMAELTFDSEDTVQDSYYYDYYDTSDDEDSGCAGMIVFLLAPISAFAICMMKNEEKGWGKAAVAAFGSSALALISLYFVISNTMNDEYGGYIQAKPMFSYYLYILVCIIGAVVGIMIIREHQKKLSVDAGAVQHVEKPNIWVKTGLITIGETFGIYVLFFLLSVTF